MGVSEREASVLRADGVACRVCDQLFHTLGPHLKVHGLTARDYRERYPDAPLASSKLRAYKRDQWLDLHGRLTKDGPEPVWTRERIIKALQRAARTPTVNAWTALGASQRRPSRQAVINAFGSWSNAMRAAGLPALEQGGVYYNGHCRRGHPLTPDNVRLNTRGQRQCLRCMEAVQRAYRQRKKRASDDKLLKALRSAVATKREWATADQVWRRLQQEPGGRTTVNGVGQRLSRLAREGCCDMRYDPRAKNGHGMNCYRARW